MISVVPLYSVGCCRINETKKKELLHVTLATFLTLKTNICHEKERVFVSVSPEEEIIQRTIQVFSYNPNTVQVINDFSVMVFLLDLLTL